MPLPVLTDKQFTPLVTYLIYGPSCTIFSPKQVTQHYFIERISYFLFIREMVRNVVPFRSAPFVRKWLRSIVTDLLSSSNHWKVSHRFPAGLPSCLAVMDEGGSLREGGINGRKMFSLRQNNAFLATRREAFLHPKPSCSGNGDEQAKMSRYSLFITGRYGESTAPLACPHEQELR